MRNNRLYAVHLALGIGIKMTHSTVVPSKHIAHIAGTPSSQRHAPPYAAVQPRLAVPVAVGSHDKGPAEGVEIWVGRTELHTREQLAVEVLCLVVKLVGIAVVHEHHTVKLHHHVGILATSQNLGRGLYQVRVAGSGFEHTRLVGSDVSIALQLRIGNVAHPCHHMQGLRCVVGHELPDGSLVLIQGHCPDKKHALAIRLPATVLEYILAHAVLIDGTTEVGAVERHAIDHKAHAAVMTFLHQGKDWTVAGLQTVVGRSAIQGPRKAVCTVVTDKATVFRPVLLHTHLALHLVVI